jgi:hypothetical protein
MKILQGVLRSTSECFYDFHRSGAFSGSLLIAYLERRNLLRLSVVKVLFDVFPRLAEAAANLRSH